MANWEDILTAGAPAIEADNSGHVDIAERIELLPNVVSIEEVENDTFLTASEGLALCREYFLSGNLAGAARKKGVRHAVALRASKEQWWDEELSSLDRQAKIEQKSRLSRALDKTFTELENRLEYGDAVVTKDGICQVPVKARDLAAIAVILADRQDKLHQETKPLVGVPAAQRLTLMEQLREKAKAGATNATELMTRIGDGSQA